MSTAFENYLTGGNMQTPPVKQTWTQENWALSFPARARLRVYEYVKERLDKNDTQVIFDEDCVYLVWFSKTLKNWKAMVVTTLPDGMYYEVTYDGDNRQTYIDAYKKFDNVCIKDEEVS